MPPSPTKSCETDPKPTPPRTVVIACAVLETEIQALAAGMDHLIHVDILEQGLHNEPDKLRIKLQEAIDRVERDWPTAEAIVLGYGLCSRGTEGVRTSRCRLVVARAHDCITHLLGCRHRYAKYVAEKPGTYWYSPGWNRYGHPPGKERYERLLEGYTAKYGPDNAEFLMESEQAWFQNYDRATYVHITIGATEQDIDYTKQCADWLGWQFDLQVGDPGLIRDMLAGNWDHDRFVVMRPGQIYRLVPDDRVLEPIEDEPKGPPAG